MSGAASIGAYTARMAACISFSRALNLLIESYFEYKKQVGHLNGYREHCCLCDAHPCQAPAEHNNGNVLPIELDQVTFQYANTEKAALAGVSACFERGKSYAIVGENGAGKSTLIKLLTGYYTPSGGAIPLGGNLAGHGLINTALPMFQQVNMYPASIRDNIQLDVTRSDAFYENSITAAGLENVLAAHGDHAMLIPEFSTEAIELSGGEAQRVALARTIFAGGAMLIMDEPTSAMDPQMEMRIYSQLIQQSGSDYDCTIIVSHRMACCRFVDVVLVMKDGRVIAKGTHDELLDTDVYKRQGLELTDVSVTIGADKLLSGISLRAEPGTITGLIGRNGSGKTMLLRAICGLVPLAQGEVVVAGQRVGKDVDFPDSIGVIIETPGFLPQYTAFENLKILARIRNRIGDAGIQSALEQVGLSGVKKRVGKFSLGMKQRRGIAQAIMENPAILLLDEPMNGLDNAGVREMRELFKALRDKGRTILLASHNPLDIEELCDSVYEMDGGVLTRVR